MKNLLNQIVKPNHTGLDTLTGQSIDWSVYRGRAVRYMPPIGPRDKSLGGHWLVLWFGPAVRDLGKRSFYPDRDLDLA